MDELKYVVLGSVLTVISLAVYYTYSTYMDIGGIIGNIMKIFIILPIFVTFIITYKLAEDFKISLIYGFFLGLIYVFADTIIKNIYNLKAFYLQIEIAILFLVVFSVVGAIGSRVGLIKNVLDEIKRDSAD